MTANTGDYYIRNQYLYNYYADPTVDPTSNPNECRPDWGRYLFDEVEDIFTADIPCWLPMYFSAKKYTIEEIYDLTEWMKENIDSIWEGPIGYLGYWKFRFTVEEDMVAVKLYM